MKNDPAARLSEAVAHFWKTRRSQLRRQGSSSGRKDSGSRGAVTGGRQCDGFIRVVRSILVESGLSDASIHCRETTLPGYFRSTKDWDLLVVANDNLIATIEFKSQVGPSFGNNFNNRAEEAIGSATDLWTAHREGAFKDSIRPWLGYFMMLEATVGSLRPVAVQEPHFKVFPEFRDSSYAKRYELLCQRLVRERLYDAACFLMSNQKDGAKGVYSEPCEEISFRKFGASLAGHIAGYARLRRGE